MDLTTGSGWIAKALYGQVRSGGELKQPKFNNLKGKLHPKSFRPITIGGRVFPNLFMVLVASVFEGLAEKVSLPVEQSKRGDKVFVKELKKRQWSEEFILQYTQKLKRMDKKTTAKLMHMTLKRYYETLPKEAFDGINSRLECFIAIDDQSRYPDWWHKFHRHLNDEVTRIIRNILEPTTDAELAQVNIKRAAKKAIIDQLEVDTTC